MSIADLPILPGETTPRPSREHGHVANWLPASEIVVGDLLVTRAPSPAEREAGIGGGPTAPVTAVRDNGKTGQARRLFVQVAGEERYPNGVRADSCSLILR